MNNLTADGFKEFYREVHGDDPFPWQSRLAERVCDRQRDWPRVIALPTAAGKTACIDIAVYALACQENWGQERKAPRRIFFVVDRRIVVDQAYQHAKSLADALQKADQGIVFEVAEKLRSLANDSRKSPLDYYSLRGGMYRESAWVRSPLQPTIITSTVDQVGSRLLFRGYGVSDSMKPIHAGLTGNDALIVLDEAHCAKPFAQTAGYIEKYREWGESDSQPPFRFVTMSATPSEDVPAEEVERDNEEDRSHPVLGKRLSARKPTTLIVAEKAKGKVWNKYGKELVAELEKQARQLQAKGYQGVGIIVNRVATARELAKELRTPKGKKDDSSAEPEVILLTGRMRAVDRDCVFQKLKPLFSGSTTELKRPTFVVATQCLEVGADLDFHALVSECASLDALRQRFGRLNRVAARDQAQGVIVVREGQQEPDEKESERDPVYKNSLSETWKWLKSKAVNDAVDFGVAAMRAATEGEDVTPLNAPSLDAPVLFPAHLDCWVQTHPMPVPDPDPAIFLHGPQSSVPDVQVVLREDLGEDDQKWIEIVAFRPPSSSEAIPVRFDVFRRWLIDSIGPDETSDVEGTPSSDEPGDVNAQRNVHRSILLWQGEKKSRILSHPEEIRPGQTYVIPNTIAAAALGDFPHLLPDGRPADCGDEAFQISRDRAILRLKRGTFPQGIALDDPDFDELLTDAINALVSEAAPPWKQRAIEELSVKNRRIAELHPLGGTHEFGGWIIIGKRRLNQFTPEFFEDDHSSWTPGLKVSLEEHSRGVAAYASRFAAGCGLDTATYGTAGLFHDIGKLDPRFQAMLKGCSPGLAAGTPLAKSGAFGSGDRSIHRYPSGARHELLSTVMLATKSADNLLLHLVATHHGSARPFASSVDENDDASKSFSATFEETHFELDSCSQRPALWNAELAERFWGMVRRFGWWGSAYRETVFRLADHAQSRFEQRQKMKDHENYERGISDHRKVDTSMVISRSAEALNGNAFQLELFGLNGSNPLAFLAALGTVRVLTLLSKSPNPPAWLQGPVRLSWGSSNSPQTAILSLPGETDHESLSSFLADRLAKLVVMHPVAQAIRLIGEGGERFSGQLKEIAQTATVADRECLDWLTALISELAPNATSQLQTVRRDYLAGNVASVMKRTEAGHIHRSLFTVWDYADALANQSLHWDPSEDRRHAYQWHAPTSDPSRHRSGGMLGANRLAIESWPLFQSWVKGEKMVTRGFRGTHVERTFWTWPLWSAPLDLGSMTSLISVLELQNSQVSAASMSGFPVFRVFQSQRILLGKTPNITPSTAVI